MMIDANNLYGGIMKNYSLPTGKFKLSDITLNDILDVTKDSPVGYIIECDLIYPDHLHDKHQDFPLAPTKEHVQEDWISYYQKSMYKNSGSTKSKKLLQTLYNKKHYTLHYLTLQFYFNMGLRVGKIHRVLEFTQTTWLEPYVTLNTNMRQSASNKFEENFYKLMNNSAYGKTCESKRRPSNAVYKQIVL